MSVNFSQNPQYIKQTQNNNFNGNAPVAEPPLVDAMANSMDLPTKPADMPFLGAAIGFSLLVSKLASWMSRVNPEKNPNLTVAETFNQSAIGKFTSKVDNKVVVPLYRKFMKPLRASQRFLKKYTPEWIKDAGRKMYVGVSPKWNIPKSQFNGLTGQSIDFFFNEKNSCKLRAIEYFFYTTLHKHSLIQKHHMVRILFHIIQIMRNQNNR